MRSGIRLKQKITPAAQKLRAVADPTRLSILYLLSREPMAVGDINDRLGLSPSLVAHHIKILNRNGFITKTKYGNLVTYYLAETAMKDLQKTLEFLKK